MVEQLPEADRQSDEQLHPTRINYALRVLLQVSRFENFRTRAAATVRPVGRGLTANEYSPRILQEAQKGKPCIHNRK